MPRHRKSVHRRKSSLREGGRGRYCVIETNCSVMFCPRRRCFLKLSTARAFRRRAARNGVQTRLVVKRRRKKR